jgi:hypothetical protein
MVADIVPGAVGAFDMAAMLPLQLVVSGSRLYFPAQDDRGAELWALDLDASVAEPGLDGGATGADGGAADGGARDGATGGGGAGGSGAGGAAGTGGSPTGAGGSTGGGGCGCSAAGGGASALSTLLLALAAVALGLRSRATTAGRSRRRADPGSRSAG